MTDSVRRSIEAVTEGLELLPPGLHLTPAARPTAYSNPVIRGGARRQQLLCVGAVATAAERLHRSSFNIKATHAAKGVATTGVQIYAVSGER